MKIQKITSLDNNHIKFVRRVRDGMENENIFVEGLRLSREAISSDLDVELAVIESGFVAKKSEAELLESIHGTANEIIEVSPTILSKIADTKSPQGVVLICGRPQSGRQSFDERVTTRKRSSMPLVVFLSEINNPANLGAVIRTSEAAEAAGVIIGNNSADAFSPKALRGAMGSAFRVPIWSNASILDALDWANRNQFRTAGAMIDGTKEYTQLDWKMPSMIAFGSEAHGIPEELSANLDYAFRIPIDPKVESLNIAVAAGVVLFEARRQGFQDRQ
jgi:TrmH family RNA methyltransferase